MFFSENIIKESIYRRNGFFARCISPPFRPPSLLNDYLYNYFQSEKGLAFSLRLSNEIRELFVGKTSISKKAYFMKILILKTTQN